MPLGEWKGAQGAAGSENHKCQACGKYDRTGPTKLRGNQLERDGRGGKKILSKVGCRGPGAGKGASEERG